jgi:hypothetical protein
MSTPRSGWVVFPPAPLAAAQFGCQLLAFRHFGFDRLLATGSPPEFAAAEPELALFVSDVHVHGWPALPFDHDAVEAELRMVAADESVAVAAVADGAQWATPYDKVGRNGNGTLEKK